MTKPMQKVCKRYAKPLHTHIPYTLDVLRTYVRAHLIVRNSGALYSNGG